MSRPTPNQIRETFINYFAKNGHQIVPSSSLIPHDDPTLLFTNAGMNQFKNQFLGIEDKGYKRAVSAQKCVRAGGKHNDLDNVGFTARHHTFFEMLGNFSFGDYFKKEAIHFAWQLLTKEFGIPKDKLYVTVYESDEEAIEIWSKQESVPKDRIFKFGQKDNFWRMGDTGPCGPCSEIFFDHGPSAGKISDPYQGILAGEDRFVEIWNLVFMQFDEQLPGKLIPLPAPSVDTGSGLERLTAALQGTANNYNTTLFLPILDAAAKATSLDLEKLLAAEKASLLDKNSWEIQTLSALRVLADHIRASCFLLSDHARPSNEGRGYVLRRIIRRALRYGHKIAPGVSVFPDLSRTLIAEMGKTYPELIEQKDSIYSILKDEETRFFATLEQGNQLLFHEFQKIKSSGGNILSGETAFKLYDTYGFPVDLTELIAKEQGVQVDLKGFEAQVEKAKQLSKSSWKGRALSLDDKEIAKWAQEIKHSHGPTQFLGYQESLSLSKVLGTYPIDSNIQAVAFDKTPIYALGGGQAPDLGKVKSANGDSFQILEVQKKNDIIIHFVATPEKLNGLYEVSIDTANRKLTTRNHSATHLLHSALRNILGSHVSQAGSDVTADRLRFDFTHSKALTIKEIEEVETWVNQEIQAQIPTKIESLSYEEAIKKGALAFFQDKYGDKVRVLSIGSKSIELCGGTHVQNTSEIGLFVIVSESSVSSGVRRIEALTSKAALNYLNRHKAEHIKALSLLSRSASWEHWTDEKSESLVTIGINKLQEKVKALETEVSQAMQSKVSSQDLILNGKQETLNGVDTFIIFASLNGFNRDQLMSKSDELKSLLQKPSLYLLASETATVIGTIQLEKTLSAGDLFKKLCIKFGGKGGGRPDLAQGFIPFSNNSTEEIIHSIREALK